MQEILNLLVRCNVTYLQLSIGCLVICLRRLNQLRATCVPTSIDVDALGRRLQQNLYEVNKALTQTAD